MRAGREGKRKGRGGKRRGGPRLGRGKVCMSWDG